MIHTLDFTECAVRDTMAPLLADKAVKLVRFTLGPDVPLQMRIPFEDYAVRSAAAMAGVPVFIGDTPVNDDPLTFFLDGQAVSLKLPAGLADWHAHTQFAYCGRGIDFDSAAALSLRLGVEMQGFSEHGFALYFPSNALKFYWQSDPDFVDRIWATPLRGRMEVYRQLVASARARYGNAVRFGLEVDLFGGGRLCLAPQDEGAFDYLIGAVHEIEGVDPKTASDAELECAWMRDVERLLSYPIRILAHPFRYFPWYHRKIPTHLYRPVARMLAARRITAEINHHQNPFELAFFEVCLEEGVQISLGSDAHITRNIADLHPHLRTLADLGMRPEDPRVRHA